MLVHDFLRVHAESVKLFLSQSKKDAEEMNEL